MVLCAISDLGLPLLPNMQKDILFAIEANRAAIAKAAQPASQAPSKGAVNMGAQALAGELAEAVAADDKDPGGHDMAAGLFGPAVSAWLRKGSADYLSKPASQGPMSDEQATALAAVGAVYSPYGKVVRTAQQYREELLRAKVSGIRLAETHYGIAKGKK
jgi:hypothetical protein